MDWLTERKKLNSDAVFTNLECDILKVSDDKLVHVLTRFILEVKKQNGEDYPTETPYKLVICLQLYMFINDRKVKLLDDEKICQCAQLP